MPTETEIWERALIRTKIWHREPQRFECGCDEKYAEGASHYNKAGNRLHWHHHYIPAPPLGSPDAVVKMVKHLEPLGLMLFYNRQAKKWRVSGEIKGKWVEVSNAEFALAIAAAVCVLPELPSLRRVAP